MVDVDIQTRVNNLEQRLDELETHQAHILLRLDHNTDVTNAVKMDTAELVALFKNAKSGASFLMWIGKVAKWVGGVVAAFFAMYGAWHKFWGS